MEFRNAKSNALAGLYWYVIFPVNYKDLYIYINLDTYYNICENYIHGIVSKIETPYFKYSDKLQVRFVKYRILHDQFMLWMEI